MIEGKSYITLDLGGTKIATALVTTSGRVVSQDYMPSLAEEGVDAVIGRIIAGIDNVLVRGGVDRSGVTSLVVAAAGAIDTRQGVVTASPNLPGWVDVPLRNIMQAAVGIDTLLLNDASAAALGEHRFGAGRGTQHLVYITVSTGIGGGLIFNGKLYSGSSGSAGEVGHMTIDDNGPRCNCGNTGCLELYASGKAVARDAQRMVAKGAKTRILRMADWEAANITAKTVAAAAREGDQVALEVIHRAASYLGIGLANLINIMNPDMIVVGGGMSRMGDLLMDPARTVASQRAFRLPFESTRIVLSELGDNAALLGGVAFAEDQLG